jgi:hypothetical protein
MDADERAIYYYLKLMRPKAAPVRDISRRTGSKRRFRYKPDWANPVLLRMAERHILETDAQGDYRLKPIPPQETRGKRWASPQIAELLRAKGNYSDRIVTPQDEDEYYEKL